MFVSSGGAICIITGTSSNGRRSSSPYTEPWELPRQGKDFGSYCQRIVVVVGPDEVCAIASGRRTKCIYLAYNCDLYMTQNTSEVYQLCAEHGGGTDACNATGDSFDICGPRTHVHSRRYNNATSLRSEKCFSYLLMFYVVCVIANKHLNSEYIVRSTNRTRLTNVCNCCHR
jgi:hypothetical protein